MSLSGDFYAVIAIEDGRARLVPLTSVLGGGLLELPADALDVDDLEARAVLQGELLVDGDEVIADLGVAGRIKSAKPRFTAASWVADRRLIPFPAEGLPKGDRQRAERAEFWLIEKPIPGLQLDGFFTDLRSFLADAQVIQTGQKEEQRRRAWHANRTEYDPEAFVNPYSFVPLPDVAPERRQPPGHSRRRAELLHGRIDVSFTALSPILVRDRGEGENEKDVTLLPRRNGNVVIPGSSVKGALRSVFEAFTGSCMRVVDRDYVPAYRDVLRAANRAGWSLVEVVEVDRERRPIRVRKSAGDPVWFSLDVLQDVLRQDGVRTGAQFVLTGSPKRVGTGAGRRDEVRSPSDVAPLGADGRVMTLLVTDFKARPKDKGVCFVAAALKEDPVTVNVTSDAWRRFEAALDGGQDLKRGKKLQVVKGEMIAVRISTSVSRGTAYRQVQGVVNPRSNKGEAGLREGHVVWARFEGADTITDLAFAQTWRHGADGESLGERIPRAFHACTGSEGLCPACSVFGSANTKGAGADKDQAYRGHLRFNDWSVNGPTQRIDLAPMGLPRPGSGQMYLSHGGDTLPVEAKIGKPPLREWGSELDAREARQIRGRKFYWRVGDAPGRPPRYKEHRSHSGADNQRTLLNEVELIGAGATISGSIRFENVTLEQLGAVVASLAPASLRAFQHEYRSDDAGAFCFTVGGGKPLGLGALECDRLEIILEGAAERYTGSPVEQIEPTHAADAFARAAAPGLRTTWVDLLELLRWNAVNSAMVSYPPKTPWPDNPESDAEDLYAAGFEWWKRSAGLPADGRGGNKNTDVHSYVTLPSPSASKVTLPIIIEREDSKSGKGGRR